MDPPSLSAVGYEADAITIRPRRPTVVFVITYNPKLPSISKIIGKHWRTMVRDPKLKNTFSQPPMVAFKLPANIRKILCHAKLLKGNFW